MKKFAKEFNEKASQKTLDAINSCDPGCGKEFNRATCLTKHYAARWREAQGLRKEYEPCAYCPLILKLIKTEKSQQKEEK